MRDVERAVCDHFHVTAYDLRGQCRQKRYSRPRQIAMYLCRQMTPHTVERIADYFGGRDHTSCVHAIRRVEYFKSTRPDFADKVLMIRASVVPTYRLPTPEQTADIRQAHWNYMHEGLMGLA